MDRQDGDKCWVAIVYDWGDEGLPIARTADPEVLRLVKRKVLNEAQKRLQISQEIDEVVAALDESEVRRLHNILDLLIREEEKDNGYHASHR